MRAAIYARVSTLDQHVENQLQELRRYADARAGGTVAWKRCAGPPKTVRQTPP